MQRIIRHLRQPIRPLILDTIQIWLSKLQFFHIDNVLARPYGLSYIGFCYLENSSKILCWSRKLREIANENCVGRENCAKFPIKTVLVAKFPMKTVLVAKNTRNFQWKTNQWKCREIVNPKWIHHSQCKYSLFEQTSPVCVVPRTPYRTFSNPSSLWFGWSTIKTNIAT